MLRGYLLPLPVHARGLPVVDLHAVHAYVAFSAFGVAGHHAGKGNEASTIQRPALEHGKVQHAEVFAQNYLLTGRVFGGDAAGEKPAHLGQHGQHLQLFHQAFGPFDCEQAFDPACHVVEAIDIERELHAALAAKLVHQDATTGVSFDVLKQQGGSAGRALCFGHSVGDFSDFENRIHGLVDVLQFARLVERFDPTPQVVVCQSGSLLTILSVSGERRPMRNAVHPGRLKVLST